MSARNLGTDPSRPALEARFYAAYQGLRAAVFVALREAAPAEAPGALLDAAQAQVHAWIQRLFQEDLGRAPARTRAALAELAADPDDAGEAALQALSLGPPLPRSLLCAPEGPSLLALAQDFRFGEGALGVALLGRVFEHGLDELERMRAEA
ncbi:MAG: hypothetical protein H6741_22205, partial [Alphaproteobacteria bacterium]|nr:hypothetical protein [Alphaproteobacteria bacterium]